MFNLHTVWYTVPHEVFGDTIMHQYRVYADDAGLESGLEYIQYRQRIGGGGEITGKKVERVDRVKFSPGSSSVWYKYFFEGEGMRRVEMWLHSVSGTRNEYYFTNSDDVEYELILQRQEHNSRDWPLGVGNS